MKKLHLPLASRINDKYNEQMEVTNNRPQVIHSLQTEKQNKTLITTVMAEPSVTVCEKKICQHSLLSVSIQKYTRLYNDKRNKWVLTIQLLGDPHCLET
jgi:hypothetical protein